MTATKTVPLSLPFLLLLCATFIPTGCTIESDDGAKPNAEATAKAKTVDAKTDPEKTPADQPSVKEDLADALQQAEEELAAATPTTDIEADLEPFAAPAAIPDAGQLHLEWIHDANIDGPETYEHQHEYLAKSKNKARLILTNDGPTALPASGWAL